MPWRFDRVKALGPQRYQKVELARDICTGISSQSNWFHCWSLFSWTYKLSIYPIWSIYFSGVEKVFSELLFQSRESPESPPQALVTIGGFLYGIWQPISTKSHRSVGSNSMLPGYSTKYICKTDLVACLGVCEIAGCLVLLQNFLSDI
jgi:hypothetical protein